MRLASRQVVSDAATSDYEHHAGTRGRERERVTDSENAVERTRQPYQSAIDDIMNMHSHYLLRSRFGDEIDIGTVPQSRAVHFDRQHRQPRHAMPQTERGRRARARVTGEEHHNITRKARISVRPSIVATRVPSPKGGAQSSSELRLLRRSRPAIMISLGHN